MLVAFRTDASPGIGTGHVMRCLALAEALGPGNECVFLCRDQELGALADRIDAGGHKLLRLQEGTADECGRKLRPFGKVDWLVVDHYQLDRAWEAEMRSASQRILVIDDLANRVHDCDLLLDANYHPDEPERYDDLVPSHCERLLGPRYALLRSEFSALGASGPTDPKIASSVRILVMFGGADADNLTGRTIDAIAGLGLDAHIDVVAGPLYPFIADLEQRLTQLPSATLHHAPGNIAELMAAADLAVGSPGTTSWERCALALPTIAIAVADNQEAMAQQLGLWGAHLYLGRHGELRDGDLQTAIRLMAGNTTMRLAMARRAREITDGRGAQRVVRHMGGHAVELRRATPADSDLLYAWRNDPRVRRHAFDATPIRRHGHEAWLRRTLADPTRILLIGRSGNTDFGCIRYDVEAQHARISIYLDPNRIGEGLAIPLLVAADNWLAATAPGISTVVAEVMAGNEASRRAFLGAGYQLEHSVFVKPCAAANSADPSLPGREKGPS